MERQPTISPATSLEVVSSESQIRENIRRFCRDLLVEAERTWKLLRQTTFWVFDVDESQFGPSKFVGYRQMTFSRYELAVAGKSEGAAFDGGVTRHAIESVLGAYVVDDNLTNRLITWCRARLGTETMAGIDASKWRFVSLKPIRRYWAFACNPGIYDGLAAAQSLDEIVWNVDRGDPQRGDRVIVWQGKGRGDHRGVVAIGEVTSPRQVLPSPPEERAFWRSPVAGPQESVRFRVIRAPGIPLWEGEQTKWLGDLAVARARGGTVFSLEPAQWHRIVESTEASQNITVDSATDFMLSQGFVSDPRVRQAIEMHAQGIAESHFVGRGFVVSDVHNERPYDLHCSKVGDERHVEVKGTKSLGEAVFLTRNEVAHARANKDRMALAIVSQISVEMANGEPIARGGQLQIIEPWDVDSGVLTPIQYEFRLPLSS